MARSFDPVFNRMPARGKERGMARAENKAGKLAKWLSSGSSRTNEWEGDRPEITIGLYLSLYGLLIHPSKFAPKKQRPGSTNAVKERRETGWGLESR